MHAVGSEPSEQPDRISSTIPSIGVPSQNPGFVGWAKVPPIIDRTTNTKALLIAIVEVSCLLDGS